MPKNTNISLTKNVFFVQVQEHPIYMYPKNKYYFQSLKQLHDGDHTQHIQFEYHPTVLKMHSFYIFSNIFTIILPIAFGCCKLLTLLIPRHPLELSPQLNTIPKSVQKIEKPSPAHAL